MSCSDTQVGISKKKTNVNVLLDNMHSIIKGMGCNSFRNVTLQDLNTICFSKILIKNYIFITCTEISEYK